MRSLVVTLFFAATNVYGLDAEAIRKIAAEPHSRENLIHELNIYPDAREYKVRVETGESPDELVAGPEVVVEEKTVRGRYIVSQAKFPGLENPMIMVVTYDKESDTFKKWVLLQNGVLGAMTGLADFEKRTIAWISDEPGGDPPETVLAIESHSDDRTLWKDTTLLAGKVIAVSRGVALKTR